MKSASYGLIALGVVVLLFGLVNHYAIHLNPVAHTSTIILGAGVVIAIIGAVMMFLGGGSNATN